MKKDVFDSGNSLEKPEEMSLIELNPNSIFLKMDRFVLGKYAPDPNVMKNYCPYFWLTVCSFILLVPVVAFKLILLPFKLIAWIFEHAIVIPLENSFMNEFERSKNKRAYILYGEEVYPWYVNKRNFRVFKDSWFEKQEASTRKTREQLINELHLLYLELCKAEEQSKKSEKMSWEMPKFNSLERWMNSIDKKFVDFKESTKDKVLAQKRLIKFTQHFMGLLVSAILGAVLYFAVNFISRGFIWLYNIWDWNAVWIITRDVLIYGGFIVAAVGIILALGALFSWLSKIIPANNAFFRFIKTFILIPLHFLFVIFLWKIVCVAFLWEILAKIVLWSPILFIIRGFIGVGPLFKSYFGQEYSALCPGIKWVSKESN